MLTKTAAAKAALVIAVIAIAAICFTLFSLSRSTDNGPPSEEPLLTFTAAGDFGATEDTKAVLRTMAAQQPDFTLALGDLSYGKVPEQQWCDMVHAALGKDHPFQIIPGNHDNKEGSSLDRFMACAPNKMPGLTGKYGIQYAFDYKKLARVVAIAPAVEYEGELYDYAPGSSEYKWLVEQIDGAREQNIPWVVVAMHDVCETMGVKACEITPQLADLLTEKNVDLILQAHEHGYMRSRQLSYNPACPAADKGATRDVCAKGDTSNYTKGDGPVIVINGAGGVELRDINLGSPDKPLFADWHGLNAEPAFGPVVVDVWKDKLQARFIDTKGAVRDSFTIRDKN